MQHKAVPTRNIVAAVIGNALEWYDFLVFAFMTPIISKLFFPTDPSVPGSELNAILMTTAIFGVGFFMRPVGGIILGLYGDKKGRKAAMVLVTSLMAVSIALITVAPTYHAAGILAPIFILIARLLQGFSAGGEFGSATAFLAEHVPGRRGFFASWQVASQGLTTLLAAGFGTVLNAQLTAAQMASWGWRVPFFFGLLLGPVAYYIRTKVDETPEFLAAEGTENPLRDTFASHKARLVAAMGVVVLGTVATYLVLFMPTYGVKQLGLAPSAAFAAILVVGVIQMAFAPLVGHWSDTYGRVRVMIAPAVGILVLIYPAFAYLVAHPGFGTLIALQVLLAFLMTGYFAALPGLLSEVFPVQTRTTGMSLAYNVAVTIFGGFGPFIIAWLIKATGMKTAPSFYLMFAAVLSLVALVVLRKRFGFR